MAVVGHIFHQGVTDALDDTALGLDPGQSRVNGNAAVNYRRVDTGEGWVAVASAGMELFTWAL